MEPLLWAIYRTPGVTDLDLSNNRILSSGADALKLLGFSSTVTSLNLSSTMLRARVRLARALPPSLAARAAGFLAFQRRASRGARKGFSQGRERGFPRRAAFSSAGALAHPRQAAAAIPRREAEIQPPIPPTVRRQRSVCVSPSPRA